MFDIKESSIFKRICAPKPLACKYYLDIFLLVFTRINRRPHQPATMSRPVDLATTPAHPLAKKVIVLSLGRQVHLCESSLHIMVARNTNKVVEMGQ